MEKSYWGQNWEKCFWSWMSLKGGKAKMTQKLVYSIWPINSITRETCKTYCIIAICGWRLSWLVTRRVRGGVTRGFSCSCRGVLTTRGPGFSLHRSRGSTLEEQRGSSQKMLTDIEIRVQKMRPFYVPRGCRDVLHTSGNWGQSLPQAEIKPAT